MIPVHTDLRAKPVTADGKKTTTKNHYTCSATAPLRQNRPLKVLSVHVSENVNIDFVRLRK